jgi:hypothetical protein
MLVGADAQGQYAPPVQYVQQQPATVYVQEQPSAYAQQPARNAGPGIGRAVLTGLVAGSSTFYHIIKPKQGRLWKPPARPRARRPRPRVIAGSVHLTLMVTLSSVCTS